MGMKQLTVKFNGRVQRTYLLDLPRVIIGRGATANISLEDNPFVSRQHAAIAFEGATHVLQDLGGPNGTFVGEKRIRVHPLVTGQRILLGKHSLTYETATAAAESLRALSGGTEEVDGASAEAGMVFEAAESAPEEEDVWQHALSPAARSGRARPSSIVGEAARPLQGRAPDSDAFADASDTVAASKEQLDEMVRRMTIKAEPHLSVPREEGMDLLPVTSFPFDIGWSKSCHFRLSGGKWFGKKAARLEKQHGTWYLVALSPVFSPVEVRGTRIKKKIKLTEGTTISIGGQRFRFSLGEE